MPNFLMAQALCLKSMPREEECKNHNGEIEQSVKALKESVETGKLYDLLTSQAD